jgi:hypothetical protein
MRPAAVAVDGVHFEKQNILPNRRHDRLRGRQATEDSKNGLREDFRNTLANGRRPVLTGWPWPS